MVTDREKNIAKWVKIDLNYEKSCWKSSKIGLKKLWVKSAKNKSQTTKKSGKVGKNWPNDEKTFKNHQEFDKKVNCVANWSKITKKNLKMIEIKIKNWLS